MTLLSEKVTILAISAPYAIAHSPACSKACQYVQIDIDACCLCRVYNAGLEINGSSSQRYRLSSCRSCCRPGRLASGTFDKPLSPSSQPCAKHLLRSTYSAARQDTCNLGCQPVVYRSTLYTSPVQHQLHGNTASLRPRPCEL